MAETLERVYEPQTDEVLSEVSRLRNENPGAGIKTLYRLLRESKLVSNKLS